MTHGACLERIDFRKTRRLNLQQHIRGREYGGRVAELGVGIQGVGEMRGRPGAAFDQNAHAGRLQVSRQFPERRATRVSLAAVSVRTPTTDSHARSLPKTGLSCQER